MRALIDLSSVEQIGLTHERIILSNLKKITDKMGLEGTVHLAILGKFNHRVLIRRMLENPKFIVINDNFGIRYKRVNYSLVFELKFINDDEGIVTILPRHLGKAANGVNWYITPFHEFGESSRCTFYLIGIIP